MAQPFPITETHLVNLFTESLLYGVYMVNFGFCVPALLRTGKRWRNKNEIRWVMLAIAISLCLNNTVGAAVTLYRCINAFIDNAENPAKPLTQASQWDNVFKIASIVVAALICDAVLIYRSYIVYAKRLWIIVPSTILWIGDLYCCSKALSLQANIGGGAIPATQVGLYLEIFWGIAVVQNIFTTSMIIFRLWKVDRQTRSYMGATRQKTKLQSVMRVVLESGLLYTVTAFITFILHAVHSNGVYIAVNAERIIASIAFNLIIIETAKRSEKEYATASQSSGSVIPRSTIPLSFVGNNSRGGNDVTLPDPDTRSQLQIKVTREVDERHDAHEMQKFSAV